MAWPSAGRPAGHRSAAAVVRRAPVILTQSKGLEQAKLSMVSRAAIAACDKIDGVKDGVISYPKQCKFDPATLACSRAKGGECLTDLEVAAIRKGYALGMSPGTEYYWRFLQNLGALSLRRPISTCSIRRRPIRRICRDTRPRATR